MPRTRLIVAPVLGLAIMAGAAAAQVPDPSNHDVPQGMRLVGSTGGVPDPAGSFHVRLRDLANNPIVGAQVDVDFSRCLPDLAPSAANPGADCPRVGATTDGTGTARFTITGASRGLSASPAGPCAFVYADGVLIGQMRVAALDLNTGGGCNPADISLWLSDFFRGTYVTRGDYDFSNTLSPADLALLLQYSLAAGSSSSGVPLCE